eukprot:1313542-Rhodomonas_salina.2
MPPGRISHAPARDQTTHATHALCQGTLHQTTHATHALYQVTLHHALCYNPLAAPTLGEKSSRLKPRLQLRAENAGKTVQEMRGAKYDVALHTSCTEHGSLLLLSQHDVQRTWFLTPKIQHRGHPHTASAIHRSESSFDESKDPLTLVLVLRRCVSAGNKIYIQQTVLGSTGRSGRCPGRAAWCGLASWLLPSSSPSSRASGCG